MNVINILPRSSLRAQYWCRYSVVDVNETAAAAERAHTCACCTCVEKAFSSAGQGILHIGSRAKAINSGSFDSFEINVCKRLRLEYTATHLLGVGPDTYTKSRRITGTANALSSHPASRTLFSEPSLWLLAVVIDHLRARKSSQESCRNGSGSRLRAMNGDVRDLQQEDNE